MWSERVCKSWEESFKFNVFHRRRIYWWNRRYPYQIVVPWWNYNVDENQNNNCNQILEYNNSTTYNEDSINKTSILPKVSNTLNYQEFSSILDQLFNACERNSEYATSVGGMMLKMLSAVDKHERSTEIYDITDDNLTNIFPSII